LSIPSPQWFVLGAGSIGCLYAAYVQRAGIATTLLLRDSARLQHFHEVGLTLQLDDVHWPVPIAAQVVATPAPPIRQLLLCTKAHHSRAAIASVRAQLADDAIIVLLQNGMGVREELQAQLPHANFIHALSTEGAWQPQRFHVVHAGHGETLVGQMPGTNTSTVAPLLADHDDAANRFVNDLSRSGLRARVVADIEQRLWQKLAVNCLINPLTVLQRCNNGALMSLPDTAHQTASICQEITAVAAAIGMTLNAAALATNVRVVMQRTANNRSSMLQDIEAGRTTEIAYLNGFVVREARRLGISAPVNAQLLDAVLTQTSSTL
jgi:2-dehydropantoate 2-reductase